MTEQQEPRRYAYDPKAQKGELKGIGGSMADDWNMAVVNQAMGTVYRKNLTDQQQAEAQHSVINAMAGITPRDEFEGMLSAQLIASHNVAMECYRRAMIPEQALHFRQENLNQANKLTRSYAVLLDTLDRHRGKGQQKVTVEHVHVYAGGQAVVGSIDPPGEGGQKIAEQPHAKQLADASQSAMRRPNEKREPVSVGRNGERAVPDARRAVARCAEG